MSRPPSFLIRDISLYPLARRPAVTYTGRLVKMPDVPDGDVAEVGANITPKV